MNVPTCADCGEPIPLDGSFRVTVRGEHVELRGFVDDFDLLRSLAVAMKPFGLVIASPAEPHGGCHE